MFGETEEQMCAAFVTAIFPEDQRETADRMFHAALRSGEMSDLEFRHRDQDGLHRELICTIAPVVLGNGERVGVSYCIRDITRRIALQNELSDSRKMAALGELAGSLSHHFNNILGGVITSMDFAASVGNPDTTQKVLSQASTALERATAIINGLLVFAKGDPLHEEVGDFADIVSLVAQETESRIVGMNIKFKLEMQDFSAFSTPREQLLTALRNITENAIEAMPQGGQLGISVRNLPPSIVIKISDTGCGMSENSISRVFEPLWSTKSTLRSDSAKGTGMGLAIAHGVVQMMGGRITVSSQIDGGSVFTISLPGPREEGRL